MSRTEKLRENGMFKKLMVALALIISLALVLGGCGKPKDLESYLDKHPKDKEELVRSLKEAGFSKVEIKGDMLYTTMSSELTFDTPEAKKVLDENIKKMEAGKERIEKGLEDFKKQTGVDKVARTIIIEDKNGVKVHQSVYGEKKDGAN